MVLKFYNSILVSFIFLNLVFITPIHAQTNPRETPLVKVVRDNASAVVNISTERIVLLRENPYWGSYGREFDSFFDQFFGLYTSTRALKFKSVGSGVILDKSGVIITNSHVVNKASNIIVVFNDDSSMDGKLLYQNPKDDLAIIKIEPTKPLTAVKLGQTDDLMIGESVAAIMDPKI